MINPACLSEFKTVNIRGKKYCESLHELRQFLQQSFVDIGYIETGHGAKGHKI